eukprot:2829207-Prymnesium_polylepis.1
MVHLAGLRLGAWHRRAVLRVSPARRDSNQRPRRARGARDSNYRTTPVRRGSVRLSGRASSAPPRDRRTGGGTRPRTCSPRASCGGAAGAAT